MFSSRFMLFPTFKKKIGVKKKLGGGGGENHFFIISFRVLCYFQHYIFFIYWLNGRWFLQIVDRDSGNLYPI